MRVPLKHGDAGAVSFAELVAKTKSRFEIEAWQLVRFKFNPLAAGLVHEVDDQDGLDVLRRILVSEKVSRYLNSHACRVEVVCFKPLGPQSEQAQRDEPMKNSMVSEDLKLSQVARIRPSHVYQLV